ncbi:hypothetical protein TraAM80_08140 [Trypanosoma rangeli]|uniref:Uncharacterized protein n=1 Tax=Trypanosoma rangeli TaxID=5698 RepID=A0A3R7KFM1_TRYRA|nr:uncharacterized protein TraAM80_08140 [Trypanosoma rangeli]RNE99506.1 hypothetical protein TraAM80_08140 [Trypanosoma rangeli]|eukprot:RNE99506.1 hypothetical protein TraAM80_08140 [Trypanosoma rangeli]
MDIMISSSNIQATMVSLESSLAPSHSLLIQHSNELTPQQLRVIVECYGIIYNILSYNLKESLDHVSVVQYHDVESIELCYISLRALISRHDNPIRKVAWVHEEAVTLLMQKNYIEPLTPNTQESGIPPSKGCLVLYLSNIPSTHRPELLAFVTSQKNLFDFFVDPVNGGRCFLCCYTIEAAEHMRKYIVHLHPEYKKYVHYCDYDDLLRAREQTGKV